MKLHFIWAMRQIGEVAESHWTAQLKFTRQALYDQRIGFADRYLFKKISPDVAQAQRDHNASRSRPNFDLHLRLSSSLVDWCETLADTMPRLVRWELPVGLSTTDGKTNPFRYDIAVFDQFVDMLPRPRR